MTGACSKSLNHKLMQGFFAAVDREMLKFWRITAADLAELAAGMTESRPTWVPKARAADTEIKSDVQAHVATSDAPVVNTLWKVKLLPILPCGWFYLHSLTRLCMDLICTVHVLSHCMHIQSIPCVKWSSCQSCCLVNKAMCALRSSESGQAMTVDVT